MREELHLMPVWRDDGDVIHRYSARLQTGDELQVGSLSKSASPKRKRKMSHLLHQMRFGRVVNARTVTTLVRVDPVRVNKHD